MSRKSITVSIVRTVRNLGWTIESLKDKEKSIAYLRLHLDRYEKVGLSASQLEHDQELRIFNRALLNVLNVLGVKL